jgi:hypothetical protein
MKNFWFIENTNIKKIQLLENEKIKKKRKRKRKNENK